MNLSASLLQENNAIAALSHQPGPKVTNAIKTAAKQNDIDFGYLLKKAQIESSFRPDVGASTSSAKGLFQFTKGTWMEMIEKYGDKYGVNTNQDKKALLSLRNNSELSAQMAAEYAKQNKRSLEKNWGGDVGATELYLAHFLGAAGAAKFLNAYDENPAQSAALINKNAARANPNIFYDRTSKDAKTVEEVYAHFAAKFAEDAPTSPKPAPEKNILTAAQDSVMDESYRLYQKVAQPFFEQNTASLKSGLNTMFQSGGDRTLLNSGKLWQMASLDFVDLLTNKSL